MIVPMEQTPTPKPPEQPTEQPHTVAPENDTLQTPPPTHPPTKKAAKPSRFTGVKAFLSVLAFVAAIIIAATLINQFIFQSYYVDGTSMTPTLHNNDRLIIDKVERTVSMIGGKHYIPKRGQIVVLDSSLVDQSGHSEQLIKRVIGLPGDTIVIDNGVVTVKNKDSPNGFNANDALGLQLDPTFVDTPPLTVTISDNQVFVMGDNRGPGGSFDSRSFGAVDSDEIQGRLLARIFPLNQTKFF
jgi:signal peptidase I